MRLGQTSFIHFLGNSVASIISFIAVILFARIVGAEILGKYYLVIGLLSWLIIAGRVGIGSAITKRVSEGSEEEEYTTAGVLLVTGISFLTVLGLILFQDMINGYVGANVTTFLIILLFSALMYNLVSSILNGVHLVHIQGLLAPVRITSKSVLQIGAVLIGFNLSGMLIGHALGWIIASVISLFAYVPSFARPARRHFTKLIEYAKYSWLGMIQSSTFNWIDVLLLGYFVSSNLVGIYSVAWSIGFFLRKFSTSIRNSIFPEISRLAEEGHYEQIPELVENALTYAGLTIIPGLIGGYLLSDRILRIYGEEFSQGSLVLVVLIISILIYGYQSQFLATLNALDRPDLAFRVNAAFILGNIALNVGLVYFYGWIGAAVATALSAVISLVFGYYYLCQLITVKIPYSELTRQWIAALGMGAVVYAIRWVEETYRLIAHNFATVILLVSLGATVYFLLLLGISPRFRDTVSRNLPVNFPAS